MLNNQGRPTQAGEAHGVERATFTGNRALEIDEPLIFDQGGFDKTGVDIDEPEPFADRLGGLARDVAPELPGFGELMRKISLEKVPTAILSRQSAGTRGRTLIVNLPGKPSSINVCLDAVFPAIPYCLDLMEAGRIDTDPAVCAAFRPA